MKVILTNADERIRKWGSNDDPIKAGLVVGGVYEVAGVSVHSWHTKYIIKGVVGRFNAEHFKATTGREQ